MIQPLNPFESLFKLFDAQIAMSSSAPSEERRCGALKNAFNLRPRRKSIALRVDSRKNAANLVRLPRLPRKMPARALKTPSKGPSGVKKPLTGPERLKLRKVEGTKPRSPASREQFIAAKDSSAPRASRAGAGECPRRLEKRPLARAPCRRRVCQLLLGKNRRRRFFRHESSALTRKRRMARQRIILREERP